MLALACVGAGLEASSCAAQSSESPIQFWLRQGGARPREAGAGPRHPEFRPQHADTIMPRRQAQPRQASVSAPATFVVAVFGDALAANLARGLADTFGTEPSAAIVDASTPDSALAQEPMTVWKDAIDAALGKAVRIDAAVLMVGTGDIRPLSDGRGGVAEPGSAGWKVVYGQRVETVAAFFRDRHIPLVWVGLPPIRDAERSGLFADLNTVFREQAPPAGATFVDVWEAFADDSGQYSGSGPDVNGRSARLRRGDDFTRTGARKLASFAEPDLRREEDRLVASRKLAAIGTNDQSLFDQALAIDVNAQIRKEAGLPPVGTDTARVRDGPVLSLTAAPVAADGRLDTFQTQPALSAEAAAVLVSGLTVPGRRGRIDDFAWPRP